MTSQKYSSAARIITFVNNVYNATTLIFTSTSYYKHTSFPKKKLL